MAPIVLWILGIGAAGAVAYQQGYVPGTEPYLIKHRTPTLPPLGTPTPPPKPPPPPTPPPGAPGAGDKLTSFTPSTKKPPLVSRLSYLFGSSMTERPTRESTTVSDIDEATKAAIGSIKADFEWYGMRDPSEAAGKYPGQAITIKNGIWTNPSSEFIGAMSRALFKARDLVLAYRQAKADEGRGYTPVPSSEALRAAANDLTAFVLGFIPWNADQRATFDAWARETAVL